eukprot:781417-Prorocentrum_minimum.AAC.1
MYLQFSRAFTALQANAALKIGARNPRGYRHLSPLTLCGGHHLELPTVIFVRRPLLEGGSDDQTAPLGGAIS